MALTFKTHHRSNQAYIKSERIITDNDIVKFKQDFEDFLASGKEGKILENPTFEGYALRIPETVDYDKIFEFIDRMKKIIKQKQYNEMCD